MGRDFRDRMRDIVAGREREQRVAEEAERRRAQDEQEFLARFRVASERVIVPVLRELEEHSNSAVRFSAQGTQVQVSTGKLHHRITFEGDYRREMVVVKTDDGDPATVELAQLDREWVENEVETRVKELVSKVGPRWP